MVAAGVAACSAPASTSTPTNGWSATVSATATSTPTASPIMAGARTLEVRVDGTTTVMPATELSAGTYVVHVATRSTNWPQALQVARPVGTLTRKQFVARYRTWLAATTVRNTHEHLTPHQTLLRNARIVDTFARWRQSVTFLGGTTASSTTSVPGVVPATGYFAVDLEPGRYWFYAATAGEPADTSSAADAAALIVEVTVTGPMTYVAAPVVGEAEFTNGPGNFSVTMPATLPTQGYLLGRGTYDVVSTLQFHRMLPGVTDATPCLFVDDSPLGAVCFFRENSELSLQGGVSANATALWYYSLPPGRYAVANGSHDAFGLFPVSEFGGSISYLTVV
jgi:hypothetical protein